jgi:hypothetical protein
MTDLELLEILERPASNLEKALAIRTLLKVAQPSALNVKPQVERKKRTATPKPKSPASDALNGFAGHVDNEGGVQ